MDLSPLSTDRPVLRRLEGRAADVLRIVGDEQANVFLA